MQAVYAKTSILLLFPTKNKVNTEGRRSPLNLHSHCMVASWYSININFKSLLNIAFFEVSKSLTWNAVYGNSTVMTLKRRFLSS